MGGSDGTRGYLYQAMVAIIEALWDDSWDKLCIEPETENQKVDITLADCTGIKVAMQVKSSVNKFTNQNIISLMKALVNDSINADEYRIVLVGDISPTTSTLVKGINGFYKSKKTKDVKNIPDDVKTLLINHDFSIRSLPIDEVYLTSILMMSINKYLSQKGYLIQHLELESLAGSLVFEILLCSTRSEYIGKNDFDDKLFRFISQKGNLQLFNGFSHHKVGVYDIEKKILMQDVKAIHIKSWYPYNLLHKSLLATCKNMITEINGLQVYARSDDELLNEAKKRDERSSIALKQYLTKHESKLPCTKTPKLHPKATIDDDAKRVISSNAHSLFGLILSEDFFCLGSLQIPTYNDSAKKLFGRDTLIGTKDEENKYKLIMLLKEKIIELNLLETYAKAFDNICIAPLAICNDSHFSDVDITVNVSLDETHALAVSPENFPTHKELSGKDDFLRNAEFVEKLFSLPCNEDITEERVTSQYLHMPKLHISLNGIYEAYGSYNDDLHKFIATPESKTRYSFHIKSLHAGEKKWLDLVVLLKIKQYPIRLNYSIISQKSTGSVCGQVIIYE